ncbi:hypothetical protein FHU36_007835 [Nonomuraea muscovyensis]|uniref:Uncharacterized protein n=1 Tax=Nonomuraea muscovyensis TaxID=1124761 RepID=A0A7X0C9W0_9ACTN|nr:hypothetical protein [Nonomuraea muscovyensis]MBB6351252.1 hypothetical protein [Nonomuraea muscovyensis]
MLSSTAHHDPRLITGVRTVAEFLDNFADGLFPGQMGATALLLLIIALHVVADFLENSPGAPLLSGTRLGRK